MATAIIVAAGSGRRMGGDTPKQYLHLDQKPILWHTVRALQTSIKVHSLVLVVPAGDIERCRELLGGAIKQKVALQFVAGGPLRQDSVFNGLMAVTDHSSPVLIHDGVRPFVTPKQIDECLEKAETHGAAMLATAVTDTVKEVDGKGFVSRTIPRTHLWLAQTPQAFQYPIILSAYKRARKEKWVVTDDAALLEKAGIPIRVVEGSRFNIKITMPDDLGLAAYIQNLLQAKGVG